MIVVTCFPHIYSGTLYPLDLVKTRMQVVSDNGGAYRSITKAFRTVIANEGYKGLYQGMSPALFAASGSWGGYFFFYERSKNRKLAKLAEGEKQMLGTPAIVRASTSLPVLLQRMPIYLYGHI
jgi:hypothetical protein